METLLQTIQSWIGASPEPTGDERLLITTIAVGIVVGIAWLIYQVLNRVVGRIILRFVEFTAIKWDDVIFNHKVLRSIWRFMFTIILMATLPGAVALYPGIVGFVSGACKILNVLALMMTCVRIITALHELTLQNDRFSTHSLKGVFQMIQLVVILIASIIIISILIGRDPVFILSGLGAAAAIIMLVFQDTILGLVAGIQLSVNDMLRPGDWICAPQCNANGTVLEVTLTTVKVQNFDMTIITIPPYTLIKDSFQNWRGMKDANGRRIMRSINIDMNTVRRLDENQLEAFGKEEWMTGELRKQLSDNPVNLTLMRHYLEWRIRQVRSYRPDMTAMVRELQPTPEGIPVEIYLFSSNTEWVAYEHTQADLLDDILAAVPRFGLRVFQRPTGSDIALSRANQA